LTTAANLILNAGASVDLNFSGTSAIHYLSLDGGATFVQPGTYGPVGSTATFTDARFTSSAGNGILSVLGAPTVAVVSSLNPSTYGDSVTFTATVTGSGATPSGTITFKDGATAMGTVTLDGAGHAAFPTNGLGAATHSITAAYSGDVNYGSATSTAISQVVNPAASSTLLVASQNPSTNGVSVTFTATVTGAGTPTGNVVLRTNGVAMATVALTAGTASAATADLPIGTNTVTAEYATQANWLGSTNSLSQVVYSAVTLSTTNAIVSIVNNNNGTFTVNAVGTPGAQYYLASASDLTVAMSSWTPLAGSTNTAPLPNGLWSFAVSNAAPAFYHSVAIHPAP
jgi:hypothetical protein